MSNTQTIGFSYKVENVLMQTVNDDLRITGSFASRDVLDRINALLKEKNFKVDERTLRPRYIGEQLYLEGFAIEIQEPKTVGFLSGRES
ncbi:hypothetical protein KHS38_20035 [Mucilaginibacter sp. Bleaf8]|uniref:hypothetical protein n=1 Tax=Mucilaginibacter sp. Bleaf8 TaxID=2834430 RepID=UPI001BCFC720|nr:hypothetical protein [Mucilaginibacter sp. Bleaf8]MBS7566705.1 hypothetical protein [Mucilaginibacter sp. Bleaf8]